jgi:biotin carboxylase
MTRTVIFVGGFRQAYLDYFKSEGYNVGFFPDREDKSYQTLVAENRLSDGFLFVLPIDFSNKNSVLNSIKGYSFDRDVLLFAMFDRYVVPASYIAEKLNLKQSRFISVDLAIKATSKLQQRKVFEESFPEITPKFKKIKTFHGAYTFVRKYGFPVIVKPSALSQSQLVNVCHNLEELIQKVSYVLDHIGEVYKQNRMHKTPQVIIEEYIAGKQYSVDSYVDENGGIVHTPICTQTIGYDAGHDNFETLYSTYTTGLSKEHEEIIFETVSKAIRAIGIKGNPTHTEVRISSDGVCKVVELNLRPGGYRSAMLKHAYSFDHVANVIKTYIGQPVEVTTGIQNHVSCSQFWSQHEGKLIEVKGIEKLKELSSYVSMRIAVHPGDLTGPADYGYQRAMHVILSNPSKEQLEADIRTSREVVEFEIKEKKVSEDDI